MRYYQSLPYILIILLFLLSDGTLIAQFDITEFDTLLKKCVVGDKVNYKLLLEEKEVLFSFTDKLGNISPHSHPEQFKSKNERLAFWINAYNAFILKTIVENYPVESIKSINFIGFTVWLNKNIIGNEKISFKSLEDDIIRDEFKDPRIHFAINCASFSCPPLQALAFTAKNLDAQMDESAKEFVNNKNNFRVDDREKTIFLSSIFDWYEDDFLDWLEKSKNIKEPHLLDYIKLYSNQEIPDIWYTYDIDYFDYDWRLNDYQ
jgi:hypothetical protein